MQHTHSWGSSGPAESEYIKYKNNYVGDFVQLAKNCFMTITMDMTDISK